MTDLIIYEEGREYVIEQFHNGHFDYIEVIQEVAERDFFRYVVNKGVLRALAETYPWPRVKEEVPAWFYIAADMAMRLHGNHAFHGFPWVVSTGGLLAAFGPELGRRYVDPETKELCIECKGFNDKNDYPRQTPCDQDFLRKIARGTGAADLMRWFNGNVQKIFRKHRYFDKAGIFIGDASYIFLPDNKNYEGSVVLLFDEHNHPVSKEQQKKMSSSQLKKCRWRRCLKMVSLLHTNEQAEFFLYAGLVVIPGNAHECPILWRMVDEFVSQTGKGVIKDLILDRGFIDGEKIAQAKQEYEIDTTIGIRRNMDIFKDAVGLTKFPETQWEAYNRQQTTSPVPDKRHHKKVKVPEKIKKREAKRRQTLEKQRAERGEAPFSAPPPKWITRLERLTSWSACTVPMDVVLCKENEADTSEKCWGIMTTATDEKVQAPVRRYDLRVLIEERHRHLKCFWDPAEFPSPNFSLVVNQVIFVALTYSLLQQQLLKKGRKALNKATKRRMLEELVPVADHITVFCDQYYARFSTYEYTQMVLTVPEEARLKLLARVNQRKRQFHLGLAESNPP